MKQRSKDGKRLVYIASLSVAITLCAIFIARSYFDGKTEPKNIPKAAIIDGLLHFANPEFVEDATKILSDAGYQVDYIGEEGVTVDFYGRLPSLGYSLIILRVHCGPLYRQLPDGTEIPEGTVLFTTEVYDEKKYVKYQINEQVALARITGKPDEIYFAVPPWFFEQCAEGEFHNTTVILDSCYGFYVNVPLMMAQAFLRNGAEVFIGWDGEVQPDHTDTGVLTLLRALCIDELTVEEAVEWVMEEVGVDPYYQSAIRFYPLDVGDHRLDIHDESN